MKIERIGPGISPSTVFIEKKINELVDAFNSLQGDTSKKEEKTDISDTTCQVGLSEEINVEALLDNYVTIRGVYGSCHEDECEACDRDEKSMKVIVETIKNAIKQ